MFESVQSLAIYVSDLEEAKRFYTEALGFKVRVQVSPDLCFLAAEKPGIDIYLEGGHDPADVSVNATRLGFFLQTELPIRDAFEKLEAAGVPILQDEPEKVSDDIWVFEFEDPDGNILAVCGGAG